MAFVLKKRIELDHFGDDWKECYLEFAMPTYKQIKEMQSVEGDDNAKVSAAIDLITAMFIGGKGFDGQKVVDIKKDELDQLPAAIITESFIALAGQVDPKLPES